MDTKEAMKIIDEGWVRKRKGYRIHFQTEANSEFITDYTPGTEKKALDSDVLAWRLAWKLSRVTKSDATGSSDGGFVNIYVVDELGEPVNHYATGQPKVYNARGIEAE
jgi:hypothetical protein